VNALRLDRLPALGRDLAHGLLQVLYPNLCVVCRTPLPAEHGPFCDSCRTLLTTDPHVACPRCAASVGPHVPLDDGCTHCRGRPLCFSAARRLGPYEGLRRDVVLRLKHVGGEGLAEHLGGLWGGHAAAAFARLGAQVIVPVPLHWWRRWRRGYNQSEALARGLANRLGLPCRPRWLRRVRHTPPQTAQTATGRLDNVRGAFRARPRAGLAGATVLLVDDVLTTGSTCREAAQALLRAGAARVVAAVLARAEN
jgi:ComF family protein